MNPEHRVPAHEFQVPILEVKRIVPGSRLLLAALGTIAKFGWGPVGYSGNAQCRGKVCGGRDIDEGLRGRTYAAHGGRGLDALQGGGRGVGIDRNGRKGLRNKSDGGFDLCRDLTDCRTLLSFTLTVLCPRSLYLFFLFPLQPRGMGFAEFLVTS